MKIDSLAIGIAGELRVASELYLRGINVYKPFTDRGSDLILENGLRVQVKCSRDGNPVGGKTHRFQIPIMERTYRAKGITRRGFGFRTDFVVIWIVKSNEFFIIPCSQLTSKTIISLSKNNPTGLYRFKDRWDQLIQGKESSNA